MHEQAPGSTSESGSADGLEHQMVREGDHCRWAAFSPACFLLNSSISDHDML